MRRTHRQLEVRIDCPECGAGLDVGLSGQITSNRPAPRLASTAEPVVNWAGLYKHQDVERSSTEWYQEYREYVGDSGPALISRPQFSVILQQLGWQPRRTAQARLLRTPNVPLPAPQPVLVE
jgi:hypothetical protein